MAETLSNKSAIVAMITAMMDTGITFMPCTFRTVGYLNAIFIIFFFGVATFFSCCSMSYAARHSKQENPTYSSLASNISRNMSYIVNVSIFFNGYLAGINFYRYLSDLIIKNSEYMRNLSDTPENSRKIVVLILAIPFFYLLLKKTLSGLSFTSYLSVISVSYLAFLMVYLYFTLGESCADGEAKPFNTSLSEGLPFFISSMVCQANMVKVYTEMESKSNKDIIIVSLGAAIGGMLVNGLTGLFGYLVFGDSIRNEILSTLSDKNILVNKRIREGWDENNIMPKMAVYSVMLVLFCGYPVQISPVVEMLFRLLPESRRTELSRKTIIAVLFLVCVCLALVEGLQPKTIKTLCGAVFSNPIAYVYPFVYYLNIKKRIMTIPGALCIAMMALSIGVSICTINRLIRGNV